MQQPFASEHHRAFQCRAVLIEKGDEQHLNDARKSLSVSPSLYFPRSMRSWRLIASGTVASMRASRLSKPVTDTISLTSASEALLCLGANLQGSQCALKKSLRRVAHIVTRRPSQQLVVS